MKLEEFITDKTGKVDVIVELVNCYYLMKATAVQIQFVREYVNGDYKKVLSNAKAANNHFCKLIEENIPKRELGNVDELTMRFLEQIYEMEKELKH